MPSLKHCIDQTVLKLLYATSGAFVGWGGYFFFLTQRGDGISLCKCVYMIVSCCAVEREVDKLTTLLMAVVKQY
jgi:hypothetical protein